MKDFFKFMFASMLGTFLVGVVLVFLFAIAMAAAIGGALSSSMAFGGGAGGVKDNSVLHVRLDKAIRDRGKKDDFNFDFGPFKGMNSLGLNDILSSLEKAKTDDRIKGIFLDLTVVQAPMSTAKEIREKLLEFRRESGKPVIAYSEFYTQGSYYIASAADSIFTVPEGDLDFRGLQAELSFYKGLLDKLDIDVEMIRGRDNIYKSFGEAFTQKEMSPESHEQIRALIDGLWDEYLTGISEVRSIDKAKLDGIADSLRIRYAPDAVTYGLIDGVKYKDEVLAIVKAKMGLDADKDIELAELGRYGRARAGGEKNEDRDGAGKKGKIAVVYAQGGISSGESEDDVIGSGTLGDALREAREDSTIKAIVLRVNSPGGSALASDVIWREVDLARATKPIVVSMGDVAASGGYYISCAASKIYAQPTTITGSIGVFGLIPNMQGFWNDKLGITFDGDKTGPHADLFNTTRPLRDDERRIIQDYVDHFYDTFLQRVADGRKLSVEQVNEIGRGRVWTGTDAKRLGLVDELGGLEEATAAAAALAGIEDYRTVDYPEEKGFMEQLFASLNEQARAWVATEVFGEDAELLREFQKMREARRAFGIQARMPVEIEVR